MKRLILGVLVGVALAIPATLIAAPPKSQNVVTPMAADLDGGGHAIFDVGGLTVDGIATFTRGVIYLDGNHNRPSIRYGTTDPNTDPAAADAQPGSLYLESAFDASGLWVETNPGVWQRVTVAP